VAVSDELGLYAHPRPALAPRSEEAAVAAIVELVEREGVGEVIVGVPLGLKGQSTAQTRAVRAFIERLRARLPVPVTEADERLSSAEALRRAPRRQPRDGRLDSEAAAIVLQAVLDARRGMARGT
jgi:putative Holliday junction resolvase